MSKAIQYITRVSESSEDEFGNYFGETISDHQAFTALDIHELEILENVVKDLNIGPTLQIVKERMDELSKKLKNIKLDG